MVAVVGVLSAGFVTENENPPLAPAPALVGWLCCPNPNGDAAVGVAFSAGFAPKENGVAVVGVAPFSAGFVPNVNPPVLAGVVEVAPKVNPDPVPADVDPNGPEDPGT